MDAEVSLFATASFTWFGLFLLTRAAFHLGPGAFPRLWEVTKALVLDPIRPGRFLALTVLLAAGYLLSSSLLLYAPSALGSKTTLWVSTFARIAEVWIPTSWFVFSLGFAERSTRGRFALVVFSLSFGATLLHLGEPVLTTLSDPAKQAIVGSWALMVTAASLPNLAPLRRITAARPGGPFLLGSGLLGILALGSFLLNTSQGDSTPWRTVGQILLLVAGSLVAVSLSRAGSEIPPFHEPERQLELARSARLVLPVGTAMLGALVVAIRWLNVDYAAALVFYAGVAATHTLTDAYWSLVVLRMEGYAKAGRTFQAFQEAIVRTRTRERDRIWKELHTRVKNRLLSLAHRLERDGLQPSARELRAFAADIEPIVRAMLPPQLVQGRLYRAISQTASTPSFNNAFGGIDGIDLRKMSFLVSRELCNPIVTQEMYYLFIEGLNNAEKYMSDCRITVEADYDSPPMLSFSVTSAAKLYHRGQLLEVPLAVYRSAANLDLQQATAP